MGQIRNLGTEVRKEVQTAIASGTGAVNSEIIDTAGWEGVHIDVIFSAANAGNGISAVEMDEATLSWVRVT